MKKIIFYFDFMSPYSYFAWNRHKKLLTDDIAVTYKPVVLAKLLNHWELVGPGMVKPKREFMLRQCFRIAHREGISFKTPSSHPFNPLYALRIATVASAKDQQIKVIDTLWKLGWEKGGDLGEPDQIENALNEAGLDGKELMENSFSREAKLELKANIKEAISYEAFGVPSFVADNELFWGNDSLNDLVQFLTGNDQWDKDSYFHALENTKRVMENQQLN